jgi:hypothetical protein
LEGYGENSNQLNHYVCKFLQRVRDLDIETDGDSHSPGQKKLTLEPMVFQAAYVEKHRKPRCS